MSPHEGPSTHRGGKRRRCPFVAGVLGAWCVLTAVGQAQTLLPIEAPAGIELFYGVKRQQPIGPAAVEPVETIKTTAQLPRPVPAPSPQVERTTAMEPAPAPTPPTIAPEIMRAYGAQLPPEPVTILPAPQRQAIERTAYEQSNSEPMHVDAAVVSTSRAAARETMNETGAETPKERQETTGESHNTFITLTPMQLAAMAGTSTVCAVVVLLASFYLLRRFGLKNLFRVEVVLPAGWAASGLTSSLMPSNTPLVPTPEENISARKFDLGPTYEDDRQAREAEMAQRDAGLLQLICEQNMQLQAELACMTSEEHDPVAVANAV